MICGETFNLILIRGSTFGNHVRADAQSSAQLFFLFCFFSFKALQIWDLGILGMPVVDGRVFLSQLMNNLGDRMSDSKGFLGYEILDFGFWADFGFWVVDFDFGWRMAVVVDFDFGWRILILGGGF